MRLAPHEKARAKMRREYGHQPTQAPNVFRYIDRLEEFGNFRTCFLSHDRQRDALCFTADQIARVIDMSPVSVRRSFASLRFPRPVVFVDSQKRTARTGVYLIPEMVSLISSLEIHFRVFLHLRKAHVDSINRIFDRMRVVRVEHGIILLDDYGATS